MTLVTNIILKLIAISGFAAIIALALFVLIVLLLFCCYWTSELVTNIKNKNNDR